jgi:hypothetical protein
MTAKKKQYLCLHIWACIDVHQMEAAGQLHAPATLALGRVPSTNWLGGRVCSGASLDAVEKRKNISWPCQELNPDPSAVQLIA